MSFKIRGVQRACVEAGEWRVVLMVCTKCGKPIKPGMRFCTSCGAPVTVEQAAPPEQQVPPAFQPVVPPAERPAKKVTAAFLKTPAGRATAAVVAVLVIAGVVIGIVFAVKGGANKAAIQAANKHIAEALESLDEAEETTEGLDKEFEGLDATSLDQMRSKADEIKEELRKVSSKVDAAREEVKDVETEKLPEWQKDCVSLLGKSCKEADEVMDGMEDIVDRVLSIGEFVAAVDAAASSFEAAVSAQGQATDQHAAGQYAVARSTAQTALDNLSQARQQLERASQLEPGADISKLVDNVARAEGAVSRFQQACDAANAGNTDLHNSLIDQYNQEKNNVSMDMTFNGEAYFGGEIGKSLSDVEDHAKKAEKYRDDARELYEKNK